MANQSIETELLGLEKRYWTAIKEKDAETAMRLTNDPCIITGAQGVGQIDPKTFAKLMESAPHTLHDFELDDVKVRLVSDNVAIVAYKIKEKLTVEGKPLTLEASDASTWIRSPGGWVCALHTEAILGDRFGRDRRLAAAS